MRINLVGELNEDSRLEGITAPNQVYAWFLRKAFVENRVDARFVSGSTLLKELPPKADHTIVISSAISYLVNDARYIQRLRSSTEGKLTAYMNVNKMRGRSNRYFDYCFTQIGPTTHRSEKYVCAGWGVDPAYSYPDQDEKAAFLDSKSSSPRVVRKLKKAYSTYDLVLPKLDIKIHNPVTTYSKSRRLPYPEYQAILRKCHYFLCTQFGDGGLNRLEAAACGALLVVPAKTYRKRTMSLLNHRVWRTEKELINILRENVDIEANRQRALEHTWDKVAKRILVILSS